MLKINDKFIIDWTPKAGCTVVCKMIFEKLNILNEALQYHHFIHRYRKAFYYNKYGRVTNKMLKNKKTIKIKFVRNPYDRAVSCYLHSCQNKLGGLSNYNNANISFEFFLKLLLNQKNNKLTGNVHYNLQSLKIENKRKIFDKIIKLEKLNEEAKNLQKEYNLKLKTNFTSKHHRSTNLKNNYYYIGDLKFEEVIKQLSTYNNFYNEKTKKLVENFYGKDIELYNYTFKEFMSKFE